MSFVQIFTAVKDVNQYIQYSQPKEIQQVLEPLSCMIRLAMLFYKKEKTKISISNNRIYFQDPNLLQGTIRWKNGDTRLDIHNLHITIKKALIWYDVNDKNINYIFQIAKKGLMKLNNCYNEKSNITSHSISYYIEIIDNVIQQKDEQKKEIDDIYYQPFLKLWNSNQVKCVHLLLHELSTSDNDSEKENLISTIGKLLSYKDECVRNIVSKFATCL